MQSVSALSALVLGVVEGLTEFIPVSSTGHLILTSHWLGLDATVAQKHAVDAFDIVIQGGAILACAIYYRKRLIGAVTGLFSDDLVKKAVALRLTLGLAMAFVPIAVVGLLLRKTLKFYLFNPVTVAGALIVGGIAMLIVDRKLGRKATVTKVEDIHPVVGAKVGLWQCLALIPGTSRSMSTMVGGMVSGMDAKTAADFSFLLSVPVLGAATGYELLKEWHSLVEHVGADALVIGLVASFVVGWASIAVFLRLVKTVGLAPFGLYRIIAGLVVAATMI